MSFEVKSEIAGQVRQVAVAEGDTLAADDVIVVLDSMKMEIPITAPKAGRVVALHIAPEDMVEEGQSIAVLEE